MLTWMDGDGAFNALTVSISSSSSVESTYWHLSIIVQGCSLMKAGKEKLVETNECLVYITSDSETKC